MGQTDEGKGLVLVTGGTGTLGRLVVERLRDRGRDVRVLSRHPREAGDGAQFVRGDVVAGDGLRQAVDGVSASSTARERQQG
jgi:uncharacterized protein YbjT (DUF2867 family)